MKIIIAGGRDFDNYRLLKEKCDKFFSNLNEIEIVCGEAKGADSLGRRYAEEKGYKIISCPAKWDLFGKSAGFRRNREMSEIADALVAFWDGKSKGTENMIALMKGKKTRIVKY